MDRFHFKLVRKYKVVFTDDNYTIVDLPSYPYKDSEEERLMLAIRRLSERFDLDSIVRVEPCYILEETQEDTRSINLL